MVATLACAVPADATRFDRFDVTGGAFGAYAIEVGPFTDTFEIDLDGVGELTGGVQPGQDVTLAQVRITGPDGLMMGLSRTDSGFVLRPAQKVGTGHYRVEVRGNSFGAGEYNGALRFDAYPSGVPEPATWVMLILGLGSLGFVARRRSSKDRRVRFD